MNVNLLYELYKEIEMNNTVNTYTNHNRSYFSKRSIILLQVGAWLICSRKDVLLGSGKWESYQIAA